MCHFFFFFQPIKDYDVFTLKISTNVLREDLDLKETRKPNVFAGLRIYLSLGRRSHKVDQNLFPILQWVPHEQPPARSQGLANGLR